MTDIRSIRYKNTLKRRLIARLLLSCRKSGRWIHWGGDRVSTGNSEISVFLRAHSTMYNFAKTPIIAHRLPK